MTKRYKKYKEESSYILLAGIIYFIKNFLLPNPYSNLFELEMAEIVNHVFAEVLIAVAYVLTRTWYVGKKR